MLDGTFAFLITSMDQSFGNTKMGTYIFRWYVEIHPRLVIRTTRKASLALSLGNSDGHRQPGGRIGPV